MPQPLQIQGNNTIRRPQQHPRHKIPRKLVPHEPQPRTRITTVPPVPVHSRETKTRVLQVRNAQRTHETQHLVHKVNAVHSSPFPQAKIPQRKFSDKPKENTTPKPSSKKSKPKKLQRKENQKQKQNPPNLCQPTKTRTNRPGGKQANTRDPNKMKGTRNN
jgi:hypothetical protein